MWYRKHTQIIDQLKLQITYNPLPSGLFRDNLQQKTLPDYSWRGLQLMKYCVINAS